MSYYKDNIPVLIEKYKIAMNECLRIVGQKIDNDLSDDKLHSALKGKRMAAEDAKWYAKEVDTLEMELIGKVGIDTGEKKTNRAKLLAQENK